MNSIKKCTKTQQWAVHYALKWGEYNTDSWAVIDI